MTTPLNQLSGMPQMRAAFAGWFSRITLDVITQDVSAEGYVDSIEKKYTFQGTVQPLDPEKIKLKPEGQQSWEWLQIHCVVDSNPAFNLKTNDRILFNCRKYKVMAKYDYSLNNYIEYHIIYDYQDTNESDT
jgi:hypothetical protein